MNNYYSLREFPDCIVKRKTQWTPRVEEMDWSPRWLEFAEQKNKQRESYAERNTEIYGQSPRSIQHSTVWCMHIESILKPRKESSERIRKELVQ